MQLLETELVGVFRLRPTRVGDERGYFQRLWCKSALSKAGLVTELDHVSSSFNESALTLRGLHYQQAPRAETKVVTVASGRVHDVVVDLRPDSPSYLRSLTLELTPYGEAVYVPEGCAHGFLTLDPASVVLYFIAGAYDAGLARGVRWDDPAFAVSWPALPSVLSPRDAAYADYEPERDDPSVRLLGRGE